VDLTFSPVYDTNGRIIGGSSIIRDITNRKRAEEELKRTQSSIRIAMDLVKLVRWEYDVETDMFAFDDQFYALYGTTAEREGGQLLSSQDYARKFIPAEDASIVAEEVRKALATTDPNFTSQVEHRIIRADGTEGVIAVRFGIIKDSKGRTIGTYGANQDITERKRAEEALRESEEKYRDLVERANDAIIIVQDGIIRYANLASLEIWGVSIEEIIGRPFTDFIDPDEIPRVVERYQRRMANELVTPIYETTLRYRDSAKVFVELNAGVVTFQGKPADLIIVRDITERKQMEGELRRSRDELELRVKDRTEELARKNSEMERFIYTVSHDLRSPLISMSGFLDFLKADAEKGDMKRMDEDFRFVSDAVTKMDKLLLDTLELSRIGHIVNPPEDVPLGEIVSEALAQSSAKMSSKNVKVTVDGDLPIVQVDRMRLVEVLVNLLENSVKYMGDQPQPEIEIGKRLDGENMVFFVRDNGIGIDPSQQDKVFGLFYKVNKKSQGSGAGLAIVKKIIEVHRGRIWVESGLGKGCTVCFTLPQVQDVFDTSNSGNKNCCSVNVKSEEP
jgi:PAS domain S-box-containing protein